MLCPSCNQKLLVPTPPRLADKTMLGELQATDNRTLLGEVLPAPTAGPSRLPVPLSSGVPALMSAAAGSPIRCVCPQCNALIKADPRRAGTRAACPGCGCPVEIPLPKAELLEDVPPVRMRPAVQPTPPSQPPEIPAYSAIILACPICKQSIDVPLHCLGQWTSCPHCRQGFTSDPEQQVQNFGSYPGVAVALPDSHSSSAYSRAREYRKSGGRSSILLIGGLAALLVVGLCGGFGLVAIMSSGNRAAQQFEAVLKPGRFPESDARAKLRRPLDLWVSKGPIVLSNTKLPGIEFDDPDLGTDFVLLHHAMGSMEEWHDFWWITVDMTFERKGGGQVVLKRKYKVTFPNEKGVVSISVVMSESGPRVIPN